MPRRNRVTPFGEIVAVPERGTFFGNRGILHDEDGRIRRRWQGKRWILCLLEFKGRRYPIMAPDAYTGLFFLDEATGLAAGHRPCAECRRGRFLEFREAWAKGNESNVAPGEIRAETIDARLHAERIGSDRSRRTHAANLDDLPDGVFVARDRDAYLVRGSEWLAWTPGGYSERHPRPQGETVAVLTPESVVAAIRAGYAPDIHPSANDH